MENYYRFQFEDFQEEELSFQALEWQDYNTIKETEEQDAMSVDNQDFLNQDKSNEYYVIKIFGVNKKGNSVCLNVENFTPFFYIKVPDNWTKTNAQTFLMKISQ